MKAPAETYRPSGKAIDQTVWRSPVVGTSSNATMVPSGLTENA